MTGKAKAVKGSAKGLDYLLDDKGKAIEISRNGLMGINGTEMFKEFKMMIPNNPTKNLAISIVVSPHAIYTKNFNEYDWSKLCDDVLEKLNLSKNQYLSSLHLSRSTKHLHIYSNRISSTGICYSDKFLAYKMQSAYDLICKERGWYNAKEIKTHLYKIEKEQTLKVLLNELKNPVNNSILKLEDNLLKKGYELKLTKNSSGYIGGRIISLDSKRTATSKLEKIASKEGFKFSELDKDLRIKTILSAIEANSKLIYQDKDENMKQNKYKIRR